MPANVHELNLIAKVCLSCLLESIIVLFAVEKVVIIINSVIKFFPLRENVFLTPPSDTKSQHYYNKALGKKLRIFLLSLSFVFCWFLSIYDDIIWLQNGKDF